MAMSASLAELNELTEEAYYHGSEVDGIRTSVKHD
jgi:hypothetical protein